MPWQELRITADSTHAEALSDALFDLGALSVSIEDAAAGTRDEKPIFGEPGEPVEQLWEKSIVVALLEQQGLWWRIDVLDTVSGVMDLVGWCHSRYLARS